MLRRRIVLLAVLGAFPVAVAGCGGDDGGGNGKSGTSSTAAATTGGAGPEEAMRAYFTAINAGDTKAICELEDDTLEQFKYDATGDVCLKDASNQNAQAAIPSGADITISTQDVTADVAQYTVKDQKGASIQVGLERVDGRWFVHVFT